MFRTVIKQIIAKGRDFIEGKDCDMVVSMKWMHKHTSTHIPTVPHMFAPINP